MINYETYKYEERAMKKNLIFIIVAIAAIGGYLFYSHMTSSTMKVTAAVEEPSFTMELPKAFYKDDETGSYINDNKKMFVEFDYYPNYLGLDSEAMLYSALYYEFYEDDIVSVEEVTIDGEDVWQAEYRTLTTGLDGIHYYYSGLLTAFELDNEIVVVDAYQAMNEEDGIDSKISDDDLQLLKDITATLKITDAGYQNVDTYTQRIECDALTLVLTDEWIETSEGENGYYDYGYYGSFTVDNTAISMEVYEYNEENKYTEEELQSAPDYYEFLGTTEISGETAYLYGYNAYTFDGYEPFFYGVVAASQHYWVDFYFTSYADDYVLQSQAKDAIIKLVESID